MAQAEVVDHDLKERNIRAILNFGHTVGHAIESTEFGWLLHGECVAIGMIKELELALMRGTLAPGVLQRTLLLLQVWSLSL